ncbi:MAG: hypothetical protein ABRQ38_04235 [Candidatus Eremiobacterota bacterium]
MKYHSIFYILLILIIFAGCKSDGTVSETSNTTPTPAGPAIYQYGTKIIFGTGGNSEQYQVTGWSHPEDGFIWTEGNRAELFLPINKTTSGKTMQICLAPYLKKGKLEKQRINIYINDEKTGEINAISPEKKLYITEIPEKYMAGESLKIAFELPDAASPKSIENIEDPRVIAIAVSSIALFEPYKTGERILFGNGGNGELYQLTGWSHPEDGFTWTEGKKAELLLPVDNTSDMTARVSVSPFLREDKIKSQKVNIYINGKKSGQWILKSPETSLQEFKIQKNLIKDKSVKITFELPDAKSPASLGISQDIRELAIQVWSILIVTPEYKDGTEITFGKKGNSGSYEIKGWSYPEDGFTWTEGKTAELMLKTGKIDRDLTMKVIFTPHLQQGKLDAQHVNISVNGTKAGEWAITSPDKTEKEIKISSDIIKDRNLKITFDLPDAKSPKSLEANEDGRVLGLQMWSIILQ